MFSKGLGLNGHELRAVNAGGKDYFARCFWRIPPACEASRVWQTQAMNKSLFARWRASFLTGLVIVLPALISIGALVWLFGSLTNITDKLLFFLEFFLPQKAERLVQPRGFECGIKNQRADSGSDESQSRRTREGGKVPRGFVLPFERGGVEHPAIA